MDSDPRDCCDDFITERECVNPYTGTVSTCPYIVSGSGTVPSVEPGEGGYDTTEQSRWALCAGFQCGCSDTVGCERLGYHEVECTGAIAAGFPCAGGGGPF